MEVNVFAGLIPALMTPCTSRREPDFDALVRKARELVRLVEGRRVMRQCA